MSEYKFTRFLKIIDDLCDENILDGKEIVAQISTSDYIPKNYKYFDIIANDEFNILIDKAEFIITHAGTGNVIPALKKGKKVIIFPRLYKYGEHIDNHQLELSNMLYEEGYVLVANNKEELIEQLNKVKNFTPKKFISNNDKINSIILDFINEKIR